MSSTEPASLPLPDTRRYPFQRKSRLTPAMLRLLVLLGAVALWEIVSRTVADPLFLSPPSRVAAALLELAGDKQLRISFASTIGELAIAFTLATGVGLLIGFLIGIPRIVQRSIFPLVLLAYAIPQTTILPLFILIFGTGIISKIAFGFSHGIFPIIIAVVGALQSIRPEMVKCARSMGASRPQVLRLVVLPSIVPGLFTGMRLGMSATLLGILLAELYVTSAGIGHYTHIFTETFQPSKLFALIAVLAAMAVILNESMRRIEIRHGRWRN